MNRMKLNQLSKEELIEHIQNLDGEIYELQSDLTKVNIKLDKSNLLLKDILDSCVDMKEQHELDNRLTFEEDPFNIELNNLIEYIKKYCRDYKVYL